MISSLIILLKDRLFRMLLTSHYKNVYNSLVVVAPFAIDANGSLIDFMSDSQLPPIHGLRGWRERGATFIPFFSLLENFEHFLGLRCQNLDRCLISLFLRGLF